MRSIHVPSVLASWRRARPPAATIASVDVALGVPDPVPVPVEVSEGEVVTALDGVAAGEGNRSPSVVAEYGVISAATTFPESSSHSIRSIRKK